MYVSSCNFHQNTKDKINDDTALGVHTLDLSHGTQSVVELLGKAPQQVKKRQIDQHKDLLGNMYNLGSGMRTVKFDEAADAMFKRTYPEIENGSQTAPVFIPETFMPRVPMGVDLEKYESQFEKLSTDDKKTYKLYDRAKELDGDMVEKRIYHQLTEFYKDIPVVVLQGAELLIPGAKRGYQQESDFIIINKKLMYILNIEAKLTLSNLKRAGKKESTIESAQKQIGRTKKLLETYFCKDISSDWVFVGAISYEKSDETINVCSECKTYVMQIPEIQTKIGLIEEKLSRERGIKEDSKNEYEKMVKYLVFTIYANPGPVINWNVSDQISKMVTKEKGQGEYRSILFWTPSQFQIMQLDEEKHPSQRNVLFISSMSTGKTECKKGMIDKLLQAGQKCHFIFYNQRCPKKTILQVQMENYYQKSKNKDSLVFSTLHSDNAGGSAKHFYSRLKQAISEYQGYNTFVDEMTLPGKDTRPNKAIQQIVDEMKHQPGKPCIWIAIAGIANATKDDFSLANMQSMFPDFFIPIMRFPLRNCKRIVSYVLGNKDQVAFDHDGDAGTSFLDVDVPDNLMEGLHPTDVGQGYSSVIEEAMNMVKKKQGKKGVAVLYNYWSRAPYVNQKDIVRYIMKGIADSGREAIHYSSELHVGVSEERLAAWMKDRGNVDLVADLCVARGWEDSTVVVVDCNNGKGVENLYMRAVSNLLVVKIPVDKTDPDAPSWDDDEDFEDGVLGSFLQ